MGIQHGNRTIHAMGVVFHERRADAHYPDACRAKRNTAEYDCAVVVSLADAEELVGLMKSIRNIMREDNGVNGDVQRIKQLGCMIFLKGFSDKEKGLEVMNPGDASLLPTESHWAAWPGSLPHSPGALEPRDLIDLIRHSAMKASSVKTWPTL